MSLGQLESCKRTIVRRFSYLRAYLEALAISYGIFYFLFLNNRFWAGYNCSFFVEGEVGDDYGDGNGGG